MGLIKNTILKYTPQPIGAATYSAGVRAFELVIEVGLPDSHAQVWTRNGYKEGNWEPFKNPVDLSLWFAREPSLADLKVLRTNYTRINRLFTLLGSLNLYVASDEFLLSGLMNSFEIEKDPQLKKKLHLKSEISQQAQAATFLFRTLEREIDHVLNLDTQARSVWESRQIGISRLLDESNFNKWQSVSDRSLIRSVVELCVRLLEPEIEERDFKEVVDSCELYFESLGRNVSSETLRPLIYKQPYLWAAFPQKFCFEVIHPPRLNEVLTELALAEICWEISELLGKVRLLSNDELVRATTRSRLDSIEEFYERFLRRSAMDTHTDQMIRQAIVKIRKNV